MGGRSGERGGVKIVLGREGWEGIIYFHISIDNAVTEVEVSNGDVRMLLEIT